MLLKAALRVMPPGFLRPGLDLFMRAMPRRHASLFRRLTRLAPATILFDPTDTPHCFLLTIAPGSVRLELAAAERTASARISGTLETLLHLLEGRIDSDTLFFSRDVMIAGDTAVAVGFRNTLDGEAISLLDDALGMAGPLAAPARRLVLGLDRGIEGIRGMAARWHAGAHRAADAGRDLAQEHDALASELTSLRDRIAKLEARSRRAKGAQDGVQDRAAA
jgi:predicted lipid carrier protein YhbT